MDLRRMAWIVVGVTIVTGCATTSAVETGARRAPPATPPSDPSIRVGGEPIAEAPGRAAHLGELELSAMGYEVQSRRSLEGSRGNPVWLDHYVSSEVRELPSPTGRGRTSIHVNAAHVEGLAAEVEENLVALEVTGLTLDGDEVVVGDVPAILAQEGMGRLVVFALGDWRVQVATDAPRDLLSDDDLVAIADDVVLR